MTFFPYIIAGMTTVITQTILVRALITMCGGNELVVGLAFACWLCAAAAGTLFAHRFVSAPARCGTFAALFVANAPVLLVSIATIAYARDLFGLMAGQALPMHHILILGALSIIPSGIISGAQWGIGLSLVPDDRSIGTLYVSEAAGFLAGGALSLVMFLSPLSTTAMIVLLLMINAATALAIQFSCNLLLIALALVVTGTSLNDQMDHTLTNARFAHHTVTQASHTPYGELALIEREGTRTLALDGSPLASADQSTADAEELALLPTLFGAAPRVTAVIGNGGVHLTPLLNAGATHIDYLETDPALSAITLPLAFPEGTPTTIYAVQTRDAFQFLHTSTRTYDAIIIALPAPVSLAVNRYYTRQFYHTITDHLNENGILALAVPGSETQADPARAALNEIVGTTLASVFPNVLRMSGEQTIYVAAVHTLNRSADDLIPTFNERRYHTLSLSEGTIRYRMDNAIVLPAMTSATINTREQPRAIIPALAYWQAILSPTLMRAYTFAIANLWILWFILISWAASRRVGPSGTSFAAGASAMGIQLILISALQTTTGTLYLLLGILTAVFMAGSALGGRIGTTTSISMRTIALLWTGWITALLIIPLFRQPVTFIASGITGLLLGITFMPLVRAAQGNARTIYAADLLGGAIAALITVPLLLPAWGMTHTLLFILAMNLITLVWWGSHR